MLSTLLSDRWPFCQDYNSIFKLKELDFYYRLFEVQLFEFYWVKKKYVLIYKPSKLGLFYIELIVVNNFLIYLCLLT
jgi:hypothetical protein